MKRIETKKGVIIETPWLRGTDEAAVYCGMVRSTFLRKATQVPHFGDENIKMYHVADLDRFQRGEFAYPAGNEQRRRSFVVKSRGLVDPVSGKIFKEKE